MQKGHTKRYECEFFQMWSELLRVTDENQGFDAYRKFLTEELMKRARKVSMSKCVFNFNLNFITHITYIC